MTASSSASWSRFSPAANFVNGHVSTMWFMVCRWPQSQEGDWARPHLCKLARQKRFIRKFCVWSACSCRVVCGRQWLATVSRLVHGTRHAARMAGPQSSLARADGHPPRDDGEHARHRHAILHRIAGQHFRTVALRAVRFDTKMPLTDGALLAVPV